jgi:hypothetical protein
MQASGSGSVVAAAMSGGLRIILIETWPSAVKINRPFGSVPNAKIGADPSGVST